MAARKKASPAKKPAAAAVTPPNAGKRAGAPPVGTVGEDAVERLVSQWVASPKQPADFAHIPWDTLIIQGAELALGREDVEAFALACTPIDARTFDYLDVLLHLASEETPSGKPVKEKALPKTAVAANALDAALAALQAILERAEACRRPIRMYELGLAPWSPQGFVSQLFTVVQACRRRGEKWDDPEHALMLFSTLEDAALGLEKAWKLPVTEAPKTEAGMRAVSLSRLLYDAITYLAAYGRAVFPVGDPRRERYLMTTLFPRQKKPVLASPLALMAKITG